MQRSSPAHLSFWILSWEAEVKYQLQPLQLSWAGVGYPDRHITVTRPSPFIPVHLHSWAQPSSLSGERTSQENTTHCLFQTASCSFHFHPRASLSEQLGSAPKFTTVWREGHPCWEEYKQDKMTEAENANTAELRWCASVHAGCVCTWQPLMIWLICCVQSKGSASTLFATVMVPKLHLSVSTHIMKDAH